jgi:hypothetical protein
MIKHHMERFFMGLVIEETIRPPDFDDYLFQRLKWRYAKRKLRG